MQGIESKLDKAYHGKTAQELADAPVDAIKGVSPGDAELLAKAFNIKTVTRPGYEQVLPDRAGDRAPRGLSPRSSRRGHAPPAARREG